MANLHFFASRDDVYEIVTYLFDETDVRVLQSYSEYGQKVKEFKTLAEFTSYYELGNEKSGNGFNRDFVLYSRSVGPAPKKSRIQLKPPRDGHSYWFSVIGVGQLQLCFGSIDDRILFESVFSHVTEARAWKIDPQAGEVDWPKFGQLSRRLQRLIRNRLGVERIDGPILRTVLAGAAKLTKQGYLLQHSHAAGKLQDERYQRELDQRRARAKKKPAGNPNPPTDKILAMLRKQDTCK